MHELLLKNISYHIHLDELEQAHFLSVIQYQTFKKNEIILKAGQVCRSFFYVNKGCLRAYHTDYDGREHIVMFSPEDWWFTDIASFYSQQAAFYEIAALEETALFFINHSALEKLYTELPKFERFFRILLQNGFLLYQQRITDSLSLPAEERYKRFQALYPTLELRIAQKHIASYLGITPVFLSMLRKRYQ